MKIIFSIYLITLSSFAFCNEIEEQITRLVKKYAREDSARVSNEINVSGACIANKGQLINTCKGQESQTGEKLGSNEQIKIEKIYYLGTFVKKLEEYNDYPNN
jgi:hypothetical protein